MANYYDSSPILTDVTFIENTSSWGGGMFNTGSSPTLNAVTFSGNSVYINPDSGDQGGWGGGLANSYLANPSLTNVTFSANSAEVGGGGMYNEDLSNSQLTNVTFFGNSAEVAGGGIYNGLLGTNASNSELTNTIVWANSPDQIFNQAGSTTTVTYSVIQGDSIYPGEGNINADPLLQPQADNGVFTFTHALGAGSSAIDTGSPVGCPVIDQRGFPRPVDGDGDGVATCDIGAFEYYHQVFLPLIMSD
jgi:predicted outer membrane repeat protein